MISLAKVAVGETVRIRRVENPELGLRLSEMGFLFGEEVKVTQKSPFKGNLCCEIRNYRLMLRWEEANQIQVTPQDTATHKVSNVYESSVRG